jgi:hypothetical protein
LPPANERAELINLGADVPMAGAISMRVESALYG